MLGFQLRYGHMYYQGQPIPNAASITLGIVSMAVILLVFVLLASTVTVIEFWARQRLHMSIAKPRYRTFPLPPVNHAAVSG